MLFQKTIYCLKAAFKNLRNNLVINIIALTTISISFIIFVSFLLLIINFSSFNQAWTQQLQVVIYFKHATPHSVVLKTSASIEKLPEVASVVVVTAQEAFNILKFFLKSQDGILNGLSADTLPSSIEVKLKNDSRSVAAIEAFVQKVKNGEGIADIQYGQQWLERFLVLFDIVKIISFILGSLLFLFTLFVITNTIKLLVYNRRDEIEIMKLVGATNAFIKIPFFIEGIFQGFFGAVFALLFLMITLNFFDDYFVSFANIYLGNFSFLFVTSELSCSIISLGVLVGFIGSLVGLQRIDEFNS
jgi:cell division transport system permease protein